VVKWQKGLNNTGDPEKTQKTRYEKEHLPRADLGSGQMTFCKYNAYYQEDCKTQQLEEL
jgi:hypothetical protein